MDFNPTRIDTLVSQMAQSLVDFPEQVLVKINEASHVVVLALHVAKSDVGKIIGKQGRTAQAMWLLIAAAAAKMNKRTVLEIIE